MFRVNTNSRNTDDGSAEEIFDDKKLMCFCLQNYNSFMMQEIGSELFVSFKKIQNAGKYIIKSCKIRKEILPLLTN